VVRQSKETARVIPMESRKSPRSKISYIPIIFDSLFYCTNYNIPFLKLDSFPSAVMSEDSTIVFVPGAWHTPVCFETVRSELKVLGFRTIAVASPSVGSKSSPLKNLTNDVANLHAAIEKIANEGKLVTVIAHSYGGAIISGAAEDLGYAQRHAAGKKGGIVMIMYLSAFAIPKGISLLQAVGGTPPPWWEYKVNPLLFYFDPYLLILPGRLCLHQQRNLYQPRRNLLQRSSRCGTGSLDLAPRASDSGRCQRPHDL
jgi:pimeloyl-ACP methyl ester carboxylesterase